MTTQLKKRSSIRRELYQRAVLDSFVKLDPRRMLRNPVMFVVEVGSLLTTVLWIQALFGKGEAPAGFIGGVALWLWFTVLFANFSEAVAEGRGKAQAEALRKTRQDHPGQEIAPPGPPGQIRTGCLGEPAQRRSVPGGNRTTSCPWMARSSKALPRWTRAPSPAKAPRSSANPAGTAAPSPAGRACSPTGSSCV